MTPLRCLLVRRRSGFQGICLNYDISVDGRTRFEVVEGLQVTVGMYLSRVYELPPDEQGIFLNRRAPWWLPFCHPFAERFTIWSTLHGQETAYRQRVETEAKDSK